MRYFILSLLLISTTYATEVTNSPFPVFLKLGFSSVLEFDSTPAQVVLGDSASFQVEKLESSLVVRSLTTDAITNMFVYLTNGQVKSFTLTASEDAVPTLISSFKTIVAKARPSTTKKPTPKGQAYYYKKGARLIRAQFDKKKDFLTVEVSISADSKTSITPRWEIVELRHKDLVFKAKTMWAERKVVQKDSTVKARFVFMRPNISSNFSESYIQIPVVGYASPIRLNLKGGK